MTMLTRCTCASNYAPEYMDGDEFCPVHGREARKQRVEMEQFSDELGLDTAAEMLAYDQVGVSERYRLWQDFREAVRDERRKGR